MTSRTAVVTGASAGIGREIVRQLVLDRGFTVLATARRRDRLDELAAELPEGKVKVLDGDLADAGFRAGCGTMPRASSPRASACSSTTRASAIMPSSPISRSRRGGRSSRSTWSP